MLLQGGLIAANDHALAANTIQQGGHRHVGELNDPRRPSSGSRLAIGAVKAVMSCSGSVLGRANSDMLRRLQMATDFWVGFTVFGVCVQS